MTQRAILWLAVSTTAQAEDEKVSLPQQEADARALCDANGWQIVDVLRVPGHSRRYIDINECARDMRAQGIDAFDKLIWHWDVGDFDLLMVRDASRFARTQTLHSYIVERCIDIGARIYSLNDGWIDESNYRMWIAMGGYSAAGEIDRLVKSRDAAMSARARRGLPTTSSTVLSHKVIRDEYGNAVRQVVDEEKRRLFDDLAALLVEGVSWKTLEQELYERFGHVAEDGRPYRRLYFYNLLHHPTFWGHSARHFRDSRKSSNGQRTDMWVFDPDEPAPEGVEIYYDTHEPVYTGELAEQVKAELRRRRTVIRGRARPQRTRRFSGLFICAECGYNLVYKGNKGYPAYACVSRYWKNERRTGCSQGRGLQEWKVQEWLDNRLREMIDKGEPTLFVADTSSEVDTLSRRIEQIDKEIDGIDTQIRRLIRKQGTVSEDLAGIYDEEISALADQLKILRANLASLERQKPSQDVIEDQYRAFETLSSMTIERFWELPPTGINQLLHRLVGNKRLVVKDAEIVGITDMPGR